MDDCARMFHLNSQQYKVPCHDVINGLCYDNIWQVILGMT